MHQLEFASQSSGRFFWLDLPKTRDGCLLQLFRPTTVSVLYRYRTKPSKNMMLVKCAVAAVASSPNRGLGDTSYESAPSNSYLVFRKIPTHVLHFVRNDAHAMNNVLTL
jgi:hypothetical protein